MGNSFCTNIPTQIDSKHVILSNRKIRPPPLFNPAITIQPIVPSHKKYLMVATYIKSNSKHIPNDVVKIIAMFHPPLKSSKLTHIIDGYIRQHIAALSVYDENGIIGTASIHNAISLYLLLSHFQIFKFDVFNPTVKITSKSHFPERHKFVLDVFHRGMGEISEQIAKDYQVPSQSVKLYKHVTGSWILTEEIDPHTVAADVSSRHPLTAVIFNDWSKCSYGIRELSRIVVHNEVGFCKLYHAVLNEEGETRTFGVGFAITYPVGITNKQLYQIVHLRLLMWLGNNIIDAFVPSLADLPFTLRIFDDYNVDYYGKSIDVRCLESLNMTEERFYRRFPRLGN